jgi:heme/copper-type cytochrome/quinol oxidase subunit 1
LELDWQLSLSVALWLILLGSMGIDILLTKGYFVVAHFHWLTLLCVVLGIAAVITLARSLYARFIGS